MAEIYRGRAPVNDDHKTAGFTLVELMVVLAIMALTATVVVLTIPSENSLLRSESDRLSARLAAARDLAVIDGRSVAISFAPSGYGFERRLDGAWQTLPGRAFAQRNWPSGIHFSSDSAQPVARVIFDTVGTSPTPQMIVLMAGDARQTVRVTATGDIIRGQ